MMVLVVVVVLLLMMMDDDDDNDDDYPIKTSSGTHIGPATSFRFSSPHNSFTNAAQTQSPSPVLER